MQRRWLIGSVIGSSLFNSVAGRPASRRHALLVGVDKYESVSFRSLNNAVNDASLIRQICSDAGYEARLEKNVGLEALVRSVDDFFIKGEDSEARFLYFAGHGRQFRGTNWLVPSTSAIVNEGDEPSTSLNVDQLIRRAASMKSGVTVMVFDACRVGADRRLGRLPRGVEGLALIKEIPRGCVVAYSTAPGEAAADGPPGKNGVYAMYLAMHLRVERLTIEQALKGTASAVKAATDGRQEPWMLSNLTGEFCFRSSRNGPC